MGKAEVVKAWKPELGTLGFVYRDNMFRYVETLENSLQLTIFVQKNSYEDTYQTGPEILIRSPLLKMSRWRVFLSANLRPGRIRFHSHTESWWPPGKLADALVALKRLVVPWFERWGDARILVEKVELSIERRIPLIEAVEPLSPEQEEAIQHAWPHILNSNPAVPVISYFSASVLHYLVGNKEMSIRRTEDWIRRLGPNDESERAEALNQLSALRDKPIQEFQEG